MATIKEINAEIMFGDLTNDQLNTIIQAIKFRRSQLAKETVRELQLGSKVKFTNSRTGGIILGEVTKINRKYVIVREASRSGGITTTTWRVPATMLETV